MKRFILALFILLSTIGTVLAGGGRLPSSFAYELVEIDYAYDITKVTWSPDGQWLSYFKHIQEDFTSSGGFRADNGDLYFQHIETGETCQFEPALYDRLSARYTYWLADSRFVALNADTLYILTPCENEERITLPETMRSIDAYSPYRDALFLRAVQATYLLTLDDGAIQLLEEIPDEHYESAYFLAKAVVSPNQRYFAVSLLGPASSFRVDIDTGDVIYLYEEFRAGGEDYLGEQVIAPYWLSDDLILLATETDNLGTEMQVVYADGSGIHEFERDFDIDSSGAMRLDDRYLLRVTQDDDVYLYDSRNDGLWGFFEHNYLVFEANGNYALAYTDDNSLAFASFADNFRNSFQFTSYLEGRPGFLLGENYFVLSKSNLVTIYETRLGEMVASVGFGHLYGYVGQSWSPDGTTFALTGASRLMPYADDATVLMLVTMSQFHIQPT